VIRLIAIDIDGTLLDSQGRIPDAHRHALGEASARGISIVLVTGRSFHFTQPVALDLGMPLTLIVNNGAVVKDTAGTSLMRRLLPRHAARQVLDGTSAYEDCVAIVFDRHDERQIVFDRMDWTRPNRHGYYERNKAFIAAVSPLADALIEDPVQVMFTGGVIRMRALFDLLRSHPGAAAFSVALTEYVAKDFSLVDVNTVGCSKGSTLARWAAARGIARDQVMAVGDNFNDLDMLEFAGTGVVMGNACDAVKARGFHITASHDECGLASAIHRFALARPDTPPI
jgi:Cof subfamily protein (haloacid dehalogenase superfamily)